MTVFLAEHFVAYLHHQSCLTILAIIWKESDLANIVLKKVLSINKLILVVILKLLS